MRYSILACWLLLLLVPFLPLPSGNPAMTPGDAWQTPAAYLHRLAMPYARWLPDSLPKLPAKALPAIPVQDETVVKTWRDEKGVVHFADPASSPSGAENLHVDASANSDLFPLPVITATPPLRRDITIIIAVLLVTAVLTGIVHRVIAQAGAWITGLRWQRQSEPLEEPSPASLPAFDFAPQTGDDPYRMLGLSPNAPEKNLRAVYEKLRARYTPDQLIGLEPGAQEAARMKAAALTAAWQQICQERGIKP